VGFAQRRRDLFVEVRAFRVPETVSPHVRRDRGITGSAREGIGDFDEDTNPDVAVSTGATNDLSIRFGNGTGGFKASPILNLDVDLTTELHGLAVADVNKDGNQDIVGAGENDLKVLLGNGAGAFALPAIGVRVERGVHALR